MRNVVARISTITPKRKHLPGKRLGDSDDGAPQRQAQQQSLRHLIGIGKFALRQEKPAILRGPEDIGDDRENQKHPGERLDYLETLLIVAHQTRHGQKRYEGKCQPGLKNALAAPPPHAERYGEAYAEGKSKQRLPDIGFQRDWYCPAQEHHEEYDAVSHAGNVQVSKLHIEDAAKGQEEENQQNVVPQSLERGVIHGRSRMRREGEWRVAV